MSALVLSPSSSPATPPTPHRHRNNGHVVRRKKTQATVTTDADVLEAVNVEAFPDGRAVNQQAVFGNTIEYDASGNIVFARALFQVSVYLRQFGQQV